MLVKRDARIAAGAIIQGRASIVDKPRLAGYYDDQLSGRASGDNPWDTGQVA